MGFLMISSHSRRSGALRISNIGIEWLTLVEPSEDQKVLNVITRGTESTLVYVWNRPLRDRKPLLQVGIYKAGLKYAYFPVVTRCRFCSEKGGPEWEDL